ncbi:hypothetical protein F5148DRAFT_1193410 [Russula earlei]|uniref:Uncharacterized protein n=1 Tax=Russula earlei TaxID=71964 RepID=A0ACC0UB28_9AGAM|nr:hypothetical protein F5148DRAFT_1193410 [Russula earlei]
MLRIRICPLGCLARPLFCSTLFPAFTDSSVPLPGALQSLDPCMTTTRALGPHTVLYINSCMVPYDGHGTRTVRDLCHQLTVR